MGFAETPEPARQMYFCRVQIVLEGRDDVGAEVVAELRAEGRMVRRR